MRVLLADDSDLILVRLQAILKEYKQVEIVGSFKNGTETLKALKTLKPDLAIVDIKMPGLSTLEILKEIRKEDKVMSIIVLTLYASNYYRKLAIQAGADFFFSKVDDFEKIPSIISDLIENEENSIRTKIINSKFMVIMEMQNKKLYSQTINS
jgi:two-component system response regulator YesN